MSDDAHTPNAGKRRGRRPGSPDTRAEIIAAARDVFLREGYAGTSMRGVARAAGVDPALVHHYFSDKGGLFRAMIEMRYDPAQLTADMLAEGIDGLGPRAVATALTAWESEYGQALVELVGERPDLIGPMVGFISSEVFTQIAGTLGVPQRELELRAGLIEVQMLGMFVGRYVARMEPLASLSHDDLVRRIGGVIQHFVSGDLGPRPRPQPLR